MMAQSGLPSPLSGASGGVRDGLDNYQVVEHLGRFSTSIAYLALCKRGRLRNRHVILKKTSRSSSSISDDVFDQLVSSTQLHQTLHHPSIVSLLSTFSTQADHYRVFEYCSGGTLSRFLSTRNPPVLSESELRGVLKSVAEALIYLSKSRVAHNDIHAAHIFLTGDYRVKLSGFRNAISLDAENCATVSGSPTDLWALGSLAVLCLSGEPLFEPESMEGQAGSKNQSQYDLPPRSSFEAKDLIDGLLQINPMHRIPLHRILSHPFFNPALHIIPLGAPLKSHASPRKFPKPSFVNRKPCSLATSVNTVGVAVSSTKAKPTTPGDFGRRDLRSLLLDEIPSPLEQHGRRVVSDPLPRAFLSSSASRVLINPARSTALSDPNRSAEPNVLERKIQNNDAITSPSLGAGRLNDQGRRVVSRHRSSATLKENLAGSIQVIARHRPESRRQPLTLASSTLASSSPGTLPVGTHRPIAFTTALVLPQTHKTSHGSITVLPSRSVLIDFREGARRRGEKGDQILVVSEDGLEIKAYAAPHLSVPSCLAEPVALYVLDNLPSKYWRQYNDAHRFIEAIKQKTPKMVLNTIESKCTLMANGPVGDIELLLPSFSTVDPRIGKAHSAPQANMRIRLLRRQWTIEISRRVSSHAGIASARQGEWTKKVFPFVSREQLWGSQDLDCPETKGIEILLKFLKICEAVEALENTTKEAATRPVIPSMASLESKALAAEMKSTLTLDRQPPTLGSTSPSIATRLSSIQLLPRPSKLPHAGSLEKRVGSMRRTSPKATQCLPSVANLTPESPFEDHIL